MGWSSVWTCCTVSDVGAGGIELAERGWMGRVSIESSIKYFSSCERTKIPLPVPPARAVRPRRWIYWS